MWKFHQKLGTLRDSKGKPCPGLATTVWISKIMLFSPADKITTKVRSLMFGGQDPSALNSDYIFLETTPLAALSGNYFASNSFKKQSFWIEQISYFHLIQI